MGRFRGTTIGVKRATKEELEKLRVKLKVKTYDELINKLIETYQNFRRQQVREIMCNHHGQARASLKAWANILLKELDPELIPEALSYLKPINSETYIVNQEKCREEKHG